MKKKFILILGLLISMNALIAQNLNDYKYVIVPTSFKFLNTDDQYQLNSLTKFLLKKEGFIALLKNEEKPRDLYENPCLGLNINVLKKSGFLNTALSFELENCKNEIVFTSAKGSSKYKEYKSAYHAALRNAFKSLKAVNYKYNNSSIVKIVTPNSKVITSPKTTINSTNTPKKVITNTEVTKETINSKILYAHKTENGFQLINNKPEIEFILLDSGKEGIFILKNKKGILYKSQNKWVIDIYTNGKLVSKEIKIKF